MCLLFLVTLSYRSPFYSIRSNYLRQDGNKNNYIKFTQNFLTTRIYSNHKHARRYFW